ncbi:MAG: class I SAM-dependent methyltransferase [Patescibacteria group bacterium]
MTVWDKIYRDYQKNGQGWATLGKDIHPFFKKFFRQSKFKNKMVLDLGCGEGKYLRLLDQFGFTVLGIDSSKTAVKMANQVLAGKSRAKLSDIYRYQIPKNKFGLVISIRALHHADKQKVKKLIDSIYFSLVPGGKIFITLPDISGVDKWRTFQKGRVNVAKGVFIPTVGPEKGLVHSFYSQAEILKLFSKFKKLKLVIKDKTAQWFITAVK